MLNLSHREILLIQHSYSQVKPLAKLAVSLFYKRLFQIAPETAPLFKGNIQLQEQKFIDTLEFIIAHISEPNRLITTARALGERHSDYGVRDSDYIVAADALFWSLKHCLRDRFTSQTEAAWVNLYKALILEMGVKANLE